MRRFLLSLLTTLVLANVLLVADALTLGLVVPRAEAQSATPPGTEAQDSSAGTAETAGAAAAVGAVDAAADGAAHDTESAHRAPPATDRAVVSGNDPACLEAETTYRNLVNELGATRKRLEQESSELAERERQIGVLTSELDRRKTELDATAKRLAAEEKRLAQAAAPSFDKLLKAYEGMDPANASAALHELYPKDRQTVIDLLLGMKPRQSAAALDALAASYPREAADLSYEIWSKQPRP